MQYSYLTYAGNKPEGLQVQCDLQYLMLLLELLLTLYTN